MLAFAACTSRTKVAEHGRGIERPSPSLSAIDSLMWRQPDSAFAALQQFAASPMADSLDVFNGHYCQLLISELLYKNDWGQSNRPALQQAVIFFDSLCSRDAARHVSTNDIIFFLDARAHYINGVGYYEQNDMASACTEYIKALETMESHFDKKKLIGHKARFMALTYNRLGDMFSEQFMMEPAITCYENALVYCRIEPTSPQGVSNILSRIGLQYEMLGDKEKMGDYYGQAIKEMPVSNNLSYRDLVTSKALVDYQLGLGIEHSLDVLRQVLADADDEGEKLTRFLTMGAIFAEEGIYDSAIFYLEPVFFYAEDQLSQIQAAEHLMAFYDSLGENEKADQCMRFLAQRKKIEGQSKASVSQLENLFKAYTDRKQQREAEEARKKSIRKTVETIVPITVMVAILIFVVLKVRSKKQLKQQQAEADRILEETGNLHKIQQSALSNRLKQSNEELRELKDQIRQQTDNMNLKPEAQALSFSDEPICRLIMERVNEGQFKAQIDCIIYKDYALDKDQLSALRKAVDRHFNQFTIRISKAYPELTRLDLDYCCLYLLGLSDADLSALMQRAYNTVNERNSKLRRIFCTENAISITLQAIANESVSI